MLVRPCRVIFFERDSIMPGSCMPKMDRGISSRWLRTAKCHDRIRIMSSNVNSTMRRPSVYTCFLKVQMSLWFYPLINWGIVTLVNMGFPCKVATTHWSQSIVILVLWKDSLGCRSSYRRSVTPPSNMLRKYLGISVRPIPKALKLAWKYLVKISQCLKITQNVALDFRNFGICPLKI